MAKYLVTYHGSGMPDDPEMMKQAVEAFQKWVAEGGKAIVDPGAPTHMVKQVSNGEAAGAAEIGGYSIIETGSLEEAEELLKKHPYVGRGGTLQLNEIVSVPGS